MKISRALLRLLPAALGIFLLLSSAVPAEAADPTPSASGGGSSLVAGSSDPSASMAAILDNLLAVLTLDSGSSNLSTIMTNQVVLVSNQNWKGVVIGYKFLTNMPELSWSAFGNLLMCILAGLALIVLFGMALVYYFFFVFDTFVKIAILFAFGPIFLLMFLVEQTRGYSLKALKSVVESYFSLAGSTVVYALINQIMDTAPAIWAQSAAFSAKGVAGKVTDWKTLFDVAGANSILIGPLDQGFWFLMCAAMLTISLCKKVDSMMTSIFGGVGGVGGVADKAASFAGKAIGGGMALAGAGLFGGAGLLLKGAGMGLGAAGAKLEVGRHVGELKEKVMGGLSVAAGRAAGGAAGSAAGKATSAGLNSIGNKFSPVSDGIATARGKAGAVADYFRKSPQHQKTMTKNGPNGVQTWSGASWESPPGTGWKLEESASKAAAVEAGLGGPNVFHKASGAIKSAGAAGASPLGGGVRGGAKSGGMESVGGTPAPSGGGGGFESVEGGSSAPPPPADTGGPVGGAPSGGGGGGGGGVGGGSSGGGAPPAASLKSEFAEAARRGARVGDRSARKIADGAVFLGGVEGGEAASVPGLGGSGGGGGGGGHSGGGGGHYGGDGGGDSYSPAPHAEDRAPEDHGGAPRDNPPQDSGPAPEEAPRNDARTEPTPPESRQEAPQGGAERNPRDPRDYSKNTQIGGDGTRNGAPNPGAPQGPEKRTPNPLSGDGGRNKRPRGTI